MATTTPMRNEGVRQSGGNQYGQNMADKAKDAASNVADKAKEMGSNMLDTAKDAASSVSRMVGSAAHTIGDRADDATASVGSGMKSLAGTIRDKAPDGGIVGSAASGVASTLESGGRYLEEKGLSGIGDDITGLVKRNPMSALLIGVGVGFLLARALTPRS